MRVRDACEQDLEEACAVIRSSITELCTLDHQGDRETLDLWLANKTAAYMRRRIGKHHVLVAVEDGTILGAAAMTATGEILLNYVSPTARFRGVSRALIGALETRAAALNVPRLTLQSSATALRFYHALGYTASGPVKGYGITTGQPMQKPLTEGASQAGR
jgi:GNAT superfamily N-acetyltransferase